MKNEEKCPCSSGKSFGECCAPVLDGTRRAATAVELMRARYSAYAVCNIDFLYKSSGPEVQAEFDKKTSLEWANSATWEGLEIRETENGGENDIDGFVTFTAHYSTEQQTCEHKERSYFKRIDGESVISCVCNMRSESFVLPFASMKKVSRCVWKSRE
jgi:SEC-C motif-containing protein